MENHQASGKQCSCPHHKVVPLAIIAIAALFFLRGIGVLADGVVAIAWPVALGLAGLTKLGERGCKCC